MANYKLNYSGEKIDELLTKIDNLGTGTDTKSGTVKLSSATDSNSGVSDGVAATPSAVSQLKTDMDTKANKTDVLSLEEIQASTDLSGKIASASALNHLNNYKLNGRLKIFGQGDSNITLSFSGYTLTRDLAGFIVISGQSGITEPISFSFNGSGIYEDIAQRKTIVGSNSYGIAGRDNGKIYIPSYIGDGWGYVEVLLLNDSLDVSTV